MNPFYRLFWLLWSLFLISMIFLLAGIGIGAAVIAIQSLLNT